MNILSEVIAIRVKFHNFQSISMTAFARNEIPEWDELSEETKLKIETIYHCIIGISSLPKKTPDEVMIETAKSQGWEDIHGCPPDGAYCRGINPANGRVEALSDHF